MRVALLLLAVAGCKSHTNEPAVDHTALEIAGGAGGDGNDGDAGGQPPMSDEELDEFFGPLTSSLPNSAEILSTLAPIPCREMNFLNYTYGIGSKTTYSPSHTPRRIDDARAVNRRALELQASRSKDYTPQQKIKVVPITGYDPDNEDDTDGHIYYFAIYRMEKWMSPKLWQWEPKDISCSEYHWVLKEPEMWDYVKEQNPRQAFFWYNRHSQFTQREQDQGLESCYTVNYQYGDHDHPNVRTVSNTPGEWGHFYVEEMCYPVKVLPWAPAQNAYCDGRNLRARLYWYTDEDYSPDCLGEGLLQGEAARLVDEDLGSLELTMRTVLKLLPFIGTAVEGYECWSGQEFMGGGGGPGGTGGRDGEKKYIAGIPQCAADVGISFVEDVGTIAVGFGTAGKLARLQRLVKNSRRLEQIQTAARVGGRVALASAAFAHGAKAGWHLKDGDILEASTELLAASLGTIEVRQLKGLVPGDDAMVLSAKKTERCKIGAFPDNQEGRHFLRLQDKTAPDSPITDGDLAALRKLEDELRFAAGTDGVSPNEFKRKLAQILEEVRRRVGRVDDASDRVDPLDLVEADLQRIEADTLNDRQLRARLLWKEVKDTIRRNYDNGSTYTGAGYFPVSPGKRTVPAVSWHPDLTVGGGMLDQCQNLDDETLSLLAMIDGMTKLEELMHAVQYGGTEFSRLLLKESRDIDEWLKTADELPGVMQRLFPDAEYRDDIVKLMRNRGAKTGADQEELEIIIMLDRVADSDLAQDAALALSEQYMNRGIVAVYRYAKGESFLGMQGAELEAYIRTMAPRAEGWRTMF